MKCSKLSWKEVLAVLIAFASLAGIAFMFMAEGQVVLHNAAGDPAEILREYNNQILPGLKKYSLAIGGILLAVSISYILLGSQDDISTNPGEQQLKK